MKLIIFFTAILLLSSCKKGSVTEAPSVSYNYTLSPTQKIKSFALDSETRYNGLILPISIYRQARKRIPVVFKLPDKSNFILRFEYMRLSF